MPYRNQGVNHVRTVYPAVGAVLPGTRELGSGVSASPFERQYAYFCEAEIERWLARQDELAMMADEEEAYEENEWLETLPEVYDHE